jgi:hypothetical protein
MLAGSRCQINATCLVLNFAENISLSSPNKLRHTVLMNNPIFKVLESPANWCGMGLSGLGPFLASVEVISVSGLTAVGLACLGYSAGFVMGGKAFGFPDFRHSTDEYSSERSEENNVRMRIVSALVSVRHKVQSNPEQRLRRVVRERIYAVCDEIDDLLTQWDSSKSKLVFDDSFNAQQIATKYLPDAVNRFSAIPKSFASTQLLDNGKTSLQVFEETLNDLSEKIKQLKEKLAKQEAQSLLNHATFVTQKFKSPEL